MTASSMTAALLLAGNEWCLSVVHKVRAFPKLKEFWMQKTLENIDKLSQPRGGVTTSNSCSDTFTTFPVPTKVQQT